MPRDFKQTFNRQSDRNNFVLPVSEANPSWSLGVCFLVLLLGYCVVAFTLGIGQRALAEDVLQSRQIWGSQGCLVIVPGTKTLQFRSLPKRNERPNWALVGEPNSWSIRTSLDDTETTDEEAPAKRGWKPAYLSHLKKKADESADPAKKAATALVFMSDSKDDKQHWEVEFHPGAARTHGTWFCHLKVSQGDYKGWYLSPGKELAKDTWEVTLSPKKPEKPLSIFIDGP